MKKKIDSLKYAVFYEWSYDPPSGMVTLFYDVRGTTYKSLLDSVTDTYDHISESVYEDEESEELEKAYNSVKASRKSIKNYSWENGGLGCGCEFLAVGTEIAPKAVEFYKKRLAEWFAWDEKRKKTKEKKQIMEEALQHPDDYAKVIRLLDMISEAIESKNYNMLS